MGETAHPFQSAALDEELERGASKLKASREAREAHARNVPDWANETVQLPLRGRRRVAREAAPPDSGQAPINGPTPERLAKDAEWQVDPQQGGQAIHRGKTVFDAYREHLNDLEVTAAERLRADAEWSTRQRTICQRTYTGMVFAGSDDAGNADAKRAFGMARFQFVMQRLRIVEGAAAAAITLIVGVRRESDGRTVGAAEFARVASGYDSKNTYGPFAAGYLKCLCQWIHAAQQDFIAFREQGIDNAEHQRRLVERLRIEAREAVQDETDELVAKLTDALAKMAEMEAREGDAKAASS